MTQSILFCKFEQIHTNTHNMKRIAVSIYFLVFLSISWGQASKPGGGPPPWAPAHGYRAQTQHIYFPSLNIYFDVHRNLYYFLSGNRWIASPRLPMGIPLPVLRVAPKVELNVVTPTPFRFNDQHRVAYKAPAHLPKPKGPVIYPPLPGNHAPKPGNPAPKGQIGPKPGNPAPKGNVGPKPGNPAPKGNVGPKPGNPSPKGNAGPKTSGNQGPKGKPALQTGGGASPKGNTGPKSGPGKGKK